MLDENKLVLAWPNHADRSSISGGSYLPSLPLTNAKNRVFAKKARSTDLSYSSTQFEIELDGSKLTDVFSIAGHNFSNSAQIRLRMYSDIAKTDLLYDSGYTQSKKNRLKNSSFEVDSNANGMADGYLVYNNGGATVSTSFVQGRVTAKAQKIAFLTSTNDTQGINIDFGINNQNWSPNKTYVISWYQKAEEGHIGLPTNLRWNTNPSVVDTISNPLLTSEWQRYAFRITWGSSVEAGGRVYIDTANTGGIQRKGSSIYDDMQIEEGFDLTDFTYGEGDYSPDPLDVWPSVFTQDELEWENLNYWEGTVLQEDIEGYTPLFFHIANTNVLLFPRKILVEIFDDSNPIGYVEFGRVFIGTAFQPKLNMQFGAAIGYSINTDVETSQNNTEYFDRKRPRRTASFNLDGLSMQEGHSTIMSLIRTQGTDQEVFFTYQNTEDTLQYNRTFLARLQQVDPIRQPYFDRVETSINLLEII